MILLFRWLFLAYFNDLLGFEVTKIAKIPIYLRVWKNNSSAPAKFSTLAEQHLFLNLVLTNLNLRSSFFSFYIFVGTAQNWFIFVINGIVKRKKYTSGPRYWNVPVLVNTGTFLVYQYCLKMWYLRSLERAGVIQKLTILECKNGLVLSNTHVPVSGTSSILFPVKIMNNENNASILSEKKKCNDKPGIEFQGPYDINSPKKLSPHQEKTALLQKWNAEK